MHVLKEMGIQSWRLRPELRSRSLAGDTISSPEGTNEVLREASEAEPAQMPDAALEKHIADVACDLQSDDSQPVQAPVSKLDQALEQEDVAGHSSNSAVQIIKAPPLDWQGLQRTIEDSQHCPTCRRGNSLLGSGSTSADWVFITDAPSSQGVQQDILFTGRAGSLFEAMLLALDLKPADVYLTSVFKCAPTEDLAATPQCNRLIECQLELLSPAVIVTFGEFSAQAVLKANEPLDKLRTTGQRCVSTGVRVVPTYSPAQMLDEPALKADVWKDLKRCRQIVQG